jgi:hypothetical protein
VQTPVQQYRITQLTYSLPIHWKNTLFMAANNPFLILISLNPVFNTFHTHMVLLHLSPAKIQGLGLTLAGFGAKPLAMLSLLGLQKIPRAFSSFCVESSLTDVVLCSVLFIEGQRRMYRYAQPRTHKLISAKFAETKQNQLSFSITSFSKCPPAQYLTVLIAGHFLLFNRKDGRVIDDSIVMGSSTVNICSLATIA